MIVEDSLKKILKFYKKPILTHNGIQNSDINGATWQINKKMFNNKKA